MFLSLTTDEEKERFIEQFRERRNPEPRSGRNPFKEEHYRRMAYANERFTAGKPGWMTDRGRIYIKYGEPNGLERRPAGGTCIRPITEGGGTTTARPCEKWRYNNPFGSSSGRLTVDQFDSGMVLKGITRKDVQEMVGVCYDPPAKRVCYFPKSVIGDHGRTNANCIAPQTTPGVGGRIILDGLGFVRFDISFVKKTCITEQVNFEFRAELFDAFNNINFLPPSAGILGTTFGAVMLLEGCLAEFPEASNRAEIEYLLKRLRPESQ